MKKYYYMKSGQQLGPFSYDELWNHKISPNTMVWHEGLGDWQTAAALPEFSNWFNQQSPKPVYKNPVRQQLTVKKEKSFWGIIGLAVMTVGIFTAYYLYDQDPGNNDNIANSEKMTSHSAKQSLTTISIPELADTDQFTKDTFPMNPRQIELQIANFIGTIRKSFDQAKLIYMHPDAEEQFDNMINSYSETALKIFFQGPIPVVKYQSFTSALILFYNPWNDLVLITDWQMVQGQLFIHDMELVTADLLQYDGQSVPQITPLWARDNEEIPIDNLTNAVKVREKLFEKLWGEQLGTGNWRKILPALSSPVSLVQDRPVVAMRLSNHYLNLRYLLKNEEMGKLRNVFVRDMKQLHSNELIAELLSAGPNTPDVVWDNFNLFPPEIWKMASMQIVQKVPKGAFVFVTTPKLTKTFLSFYYKFDANENLTLDRIDWCTFDNEL